MGVVSNAMNSLFGVNSGVVDSAHSVNPIVNDPNRVGGLEMGQTFRNPVTGFNKEPMVISEEFDNAMSRIFDMTLVNHDLIVTTTLMQWATENQLSIVKATNALNKLGALAIEGAQPGLELDMTEYHGLSIEQFTRYNGIANRVITSNMSILGVISGEVAYICPDTMRDMDSYYNKIQGAKQYFNTGEDTNTIIGISLLAEIT